MNFFPKDDGSISTRRIWLLSRKKIGEKFTYVTVMSARSKPVTGSLKAMVKVTAPEAVDAPEWSS